MIVHEDRLVEQARPIAYMLANGYLAQHAALSDTFAMRPQKLLVYLIILTATVQKQMRRTDFPPEYQGTARMPRAMIGYISRRAIAAASGLPRENVRRIVNEMLAEGLLLTGPRGALANKGGTLESARVLEGLRRLVQETAHMADQLLRAGILEMPSAPGHDAG